MLMHHGRSRVARDLTVEHMAGDAQYDEDERRKLAKFPAALSSDTSDAADDAVQDAEEVVDDPVEAWGAGRIAHLAECYGYNALEDPAVVSDYVQSNLFAFAVFRSKGEGDGGEPDGKGKRPIRPSHLSIQDRREKLLERKAKMDCDSCGRKDRSAGDPACSMGKSGSSTTTKTSTVRQANLWVREGYGLPIGVSKVVDTDDEGSDHDADRVVLMMRRIPRRGKGAGSSGPKGPSPLSGSDGEVARIQPDDGCVAPRHDTMIAFGRFEGYTSLGLLQKHPTHSNTS
jgi:hypothetical protein